MGLGARASPFAESLSCRASNKTLLQIRKVVCCGEAGRVWFDLVFLRLGFVMPRDARGGVVRFRRRPVGGLSVWRRMDFGFNFVAPDSGSMVRALSREASGVLDM